MPEINLSTLSGPELRQVLDASRRRGDAALSYKVLQEMAARRETRAGEKRSFRKRRAGERAELTIEVEEPAADDELPPLPPWLRREANGEVVDAAGIEAPREAAAVAPAAEPERPPEPGPEPEPKAARRPAAGLRLEDPAPAYEAAADPHDEGLRLAPEGPASGRAGQGRPPRKPRRPIRPPLGFAVGLALGAALGWAVAVYREPPAAPPAPVQTAALTPPAAAPASPPADSAASGASDQVEGAVTPPAAASPPAAATAPDTTGPGSEAGLAAPPSAAQAPPAATPPAPSVRAAEPPPEVAETVPATGAAGKGCAALSTPADRAICGDPELKRLQKELQRAYAAALAAHEDRALLRERQLAWRDERNEVADPAQLAKLYEARIRKLEAATAEAKKLRQGGEAPR